MEEGLYEEYQEIESTHGIELERELLRFYSFVEIDISEEELILEFEKFGDKKRMFYMNKEVSDWCRQNKMRPRICVDENKKLWLKFSKKSQLVLFKLRWI